MRAVTVTIAIKTDSIFLCAHWELPVRVHVRYRTEDVTTRVQTFRKYVVECTKTVILVVVVVVVYALNPSMCAVLCESSNIYKVIYYLFTLYYKYVCLKKQIKKWTTRTFRLKYLTWPWLNVHIGRVLCRIESIGVLRRLFRKRRCTTAKCYRKSVTSKPAINANDSLIG